MAPRNVASPPLVRRRWRRGLDLIAVAAAVVGSSWLASRRLGIGEDRSLRDMAREAAKVTARQVYMGSGRGLPGTPPSAKSLRHRHEMEDMSGRDMAFVLLGLAGFVALFSGASIGMTALFHTWNHSRVPLTTEQTARISPPGPHLQAHPHAELRDVRAQETQLLHAYAWLDPGHTVARIPIERAMALTVGKSLDSRP